MSLKREQAVSSHICQFLKISIPLMTGLEIVKSLAGESEDREQVLSSSHICQFLKILNSSDERT